jgi:hypothetical protein
MRDLWRSTTSLLRQHPILWLPVAIVEFVNFNLRWLENLFDNWWFHQLLLRQSEGRSVLSVSPLSVAPTHATILKIETITIPIGLTTQLIYDVLLACALFSTAAILQRIAETGRGTLRDAVAPVKSSIRRIMVYALTLFGLGVIAGSLISFLSTLVHPLNLLDFQSKLEKVLSLSLQSQFALERSNFIPTFINSLLHYLWTIPITLCVVYVIAPLQVRLLLPPGTNPTTQQARSARIAGTLAALALAACAFLLLQVSIWFIPSSFPGARYFLQAVIPLASLAIYTPLFIAIYLIANPGSPLAIPSSPPNIPPEEEDTTPAEDAP